MAEWNPDVLRDIQRASELEVSPLRADGVTYRRPTVIWSVVVDGVLYLRAYNGPDASWYRVARRQGRGRVSAGGRTVDVSFTPADPGVSAAVDQAYRAKYGRSAYLAPMVAPGAVEATLLVEPLD